MKNLVLLTTLSLGLFSIGILSVAEAHPHSTLELMDNHSHDLYNTEDFFIHTFEKVIFLVGQIQNIIFR